MVTDPIAQTLLSAAFVGTGALFAVRALRPGARAERVGDVVHLLMSVSMLAMTWPATATLVPAAPQAVLFALAAVWFGVRAARHGRAHWLPWFHLVMSAAMTWMLLAMAPPTAHTSTSTGTGADTGAMTHQHAVDGTWATSTGLVLLVLLLAGTALSASSASLTRAGTAGRRRAVPVQDLAHVAMGLGMVAMAGPALLT